ncbi:DUF2087 domain-containing protein [Aestuariicoccus sp. MJ-SS9]|uniref:DUF2087 domain-containing protein n=1 Tax=Aestuariicoccus sp. MJ-SS9 TaxID=3079855 RepID=UPI0029075E51|nr:DUF2087 domain-containing protein [Aestuariicoccus sp. MJ-SS9]MDU8911487.1 DUF2087 domain-containing protein [Aestuariicoccus sp. MJ-SS9]
MTRDLVSLTIDDLSHFAKTLRAQLDAPPSHLQLLGMVARAAGYRNFQHLRAAQTPVPAFDRTRVSRALRHFDAEGRLLRWPSRNAMQNLCLWPIWAALPARETMTERQISARIDALTAFRDAAQIRRALVEFGMVTRNIDGSVYCRREQVPPPEALAVIRGLRGAG